MPIKTYGLLRQQQSGGPAQSPLADQAVLLLLLLVHQPDQPPSLVNPFKHSLYNLQDAESSMDAEGEKGEGGG